ncbi:MAG: tetratricopeptide repeat protein [Burkholderiales bacterium]
MLRDLRGEAVSGATPAALDEFERALDLFLACRGNAGAPVRAACEAAPGFAMAFALEACLQLSGRDPAGGRQALRVLACFRGEPALPRERLHFAAIRALARGDYDQARHLHDELLAEHPRDVLAVQIAHSFDYVAGDARSLRDRIAWVLPAWSAADPGYHALLSMHAFGLEECGEYALAEDTALRALELNPRDLRAHHAVTHVLEMLERAEAGMRWMGSRTAYWLDDGPAAMHLWWHLALHHLGAGRQRHALMLYDQRIGVPRGRSMSALIDASALLWRLELMHVDVGSRWQALADRWAPHAADAFCAFNDLHAMMAFIGAGRDELAQRLIAAQEARIGAGGANATMTRLVGLPACRALRAYGRGDYAEAERQLRRLPPVAHRIGGSLAQRNVLEMTREAAVQRALPIAA